MKGKVKEEMRKFILGKGADLVGVASVDRFVPFSRFFRKAKIGHLGSMKLLV